MINRLPASISTENSSPIAGPKKNAEVGIKGEGTGDAGERIKGGHDEIRIFAFKAQEKPVQVHDIHATILYLMGIDHKKLTYRYSGRDFRLTDVAGNVIHDIVA